MYDLSIIIPTYNNVEYLDECIDSILISGEDIKYEVLFGIDGCDKSLEYFKNKQLPENFNVYLFTENGGPYTIKNTLASMSKSNTLLFFDSDDIMGELMMKNIISKIDKHTCIKLKLINFKNDSGNIDSSRKTSYGEGVFSIKKDVFMSMNGFEPWICAADSDFMNRVNKLKVSIYHTQEVMFYRRLHNSGLTTRSDTGLRSILRGKYSKIMNQKIGIGNPDKLNIRSCVEISLLSGDVELTKSIELSSPPRTNIIGRLLQTGEPRKRVEPGEINYNSVNSNRSIKEDVPVKTTKLIPKNRQELINKKNSGSLSSTSRNMFNNKPNKKLDLPNITIGKDNLRIN